jgi:hypothetical protein
MVIATDTITASAGKGRPLLFIQLQDPASHHANLQVGKRDLSPLSAEDIAATTRHVTKLFVCIRYFLSVLLTKAICLLSGDHDGTLIVPWPPYR